MSNKATTKRINVTTTSYEGDVAFPEASHYPEFVAAELAERYGAEIDASGGGLKTTVFLYGFGEDESSLSDEILELVKISLWDAFCDQGYKAYTKEGSA